MYILRGKIYRILMHILISHLSIVTSIYGELWNQSSYLLAAFPKEVK